MSKRFNTVISLWPAVPGPLLLEDWMGGGWLDILIGRLKSYENDKWIQLDSAGPRLRASIVLVSLLISLMLAGASHDHSTQRA